MAFYESADYIEACEEKAIFEHELDTLLNILFDGIMTDSYINPHGVFAYLKAVYPNRFKRKMEQLYAQDDKSDRDS